MKKFTKETILKVSMLVSMVAMGFVISMGSFSYVKANEASTVSGNGTIENPEQNNQDKKVSFIQVQLDTEIAKGGSFPKKIEVTEGLLNNGILNPTYDELKAELDNYFVGLKFRREDGNLNLIEKLEYYTIDQDVVSNPDITKLNVYEPTQQEAFYSDHLRQYGVRVYAKVVQYVIVKNPLETEDADSPKVEVTEEAPAVVAVPQTPETNYAVFQESIMKDIDTAIVEATKVSAGQKNAANNNATAVVEPIKIDTWTWISFKGNVYQKMQDSGLPVQITFRHKGIRYRVNIPANADLMSLVDKNGYCGFLNLMAHFGGTVIDK